MRTGTAAAMACIAMTCASLAMAQEADSYEEAAEAPPQITMGNGERNSIQTEGLTRAEGVSHFSFMRLDDDVVSRFAEYGSELAILEPIWVNDQVRKHLLDCSVSHQAA